MSVALSVAINHMGDWTVEELVLAAILDEFPAQPIQCREYNDLIIIKKIQDGNHRRLCNCDGHHH